MARTARRTGPGVSRARSARGGSDEATLVLPRDEPFAGEGPNIGTGPVGVARRRVRDRCQATRGHRGVFTAWLLGNKKVQIDIAKSGVALVTCGDLPGKGQGSLQWLVTPEWY